PKVMIVWATPHGRTGHVYSSTAGPRSHLPPALTAMLGRPFDPKTFRWPAVLNKTCALVIVHGTSEAGRPYAKVSSVVPLPPGLTAPPEEGATVNWAMGDALDALDAVDLPYVWGKPASEFVTEAQDYGDFYDDDGNRKVASPPAAPSANGAA